MVLGASFCALLLPKWLLGSVSEATDISCKNKFATISAFWGKVGGPGERAGGIGLTIGHALRSKCGGGYDHSTSFLVFSMLFMMFHASFSGYSRDHTETS